MNIVINGLYRHYKGNEYKVIAIAKHSESLEDLVVYQDVRNVDKIWARPISMWNDEIVIDSKKVKRFEKIK